MGTVTPADLTDLRIALARFADERDWAGFHTPKNLMLALVGEVGELASELQWKTEQQIAEVAGDERVRLGDELADVLFYVIRLADVLNVDLVVAAERKLADNTRRYPASEVFGSAKKMPH